MIQCTSTEMKMHSGAYAAHSGGGRLPYVAGSLGSTVGDVVFKYPE